MKTQLNPIALANTFAIIDLVIHPLFHVWVAINPNSYEYLMQLFVAGLRLRVESFELSFGNVVLSTALEASIFWLLGYIGATLYNKLSK